MVHLLQSLSDVEIRIGLVTLFLSGMANNQQRRYLVTAARGGVRVINSKQHEGAGYSESDFIVVIF